MLLDPMCKRRMSGGRELRPTIQTEIGGMTFLGAGVIQRPSAGKVAIATENDEN